MTGGMDADVSLLIVLSLVLAAWSLVLMVFGRPIGRVFRICGGIFCGLMLAFAIWRLAHLGAIAATASVPVVLGYLVAGVIIPAVALWWTRSDATRAGSGVMLVAFLAVAVVTLRVSQVWTGA